MGWRGELWRSFLFLLRRDEMAKDFAEISLHLELRAEEYGAAGMKPRDAHARALRGFGNVTQISEQGRAVWHWEDARNLVETATQAGAVIGSGKTVFENRRVAVEETLSD